MTNKNVTLINTNDYIGGAAQSTWKLHNDLQKYNINSYMIVRHKITNDDKIIKIHYNLIAKIIYFIQFHIIRHINHHPFTGLKHLNEISKLIIEKINFISNNIPNLTPQKPNLIHANNLHGDYFSIYSLPFLSNNFPFVYTLRDTWAFTGHCAYYIDCYKWKTGCEQCPYLDIYPPMPADYTKYYWKLKKYIYKQSKLFITTPSKWLMDNATQSILKPAIVKAKVIPNGINTNVFYPINSTNNKNSLRIKLGFNKKHKIIIFVAQGTKKNPFKDYQTIKNSVSQIAKTTPNIIFLAIGGKKNYTEQINNAQIKHIKYQKKPDTLADYYRISDLFIHSAKAEVFGTVLIEAAACGIPAIASAVGGIPEIINGLNYNNNNNYNTHSINNATGILTKPQDSEDMINAISYLLNNENIRLTLAQNAGSHTKLNFSQEITTQKYINFYKEILEDQQKLQNK